MHVLSDANGLPLLVGVSAANVHDSEALQPMVAGHQTKRTFIDDADVMAAIEEVDHSGLVPLLEKFVHLPRGRHRTLHLRSLLIGLHLCTQITGSKIVPVQVTDILYFRLAPPMRALLDIPEYEDHDQGFEAAYAVVRRLFHAMKHAMNLSPLPANGHLSREETHELAASADVEELAERERRLALFTEFLLDASVRPPHNLLSELAEVSIGIDATPIRTFSRGRRTNGPELATDPDAGWYVREGDHRRPRRRTLHRRPTREPKIWTPTGHLTPAA